MKIRQATRQNAAAIRQMYQAVARISQGIARTESELTEEYFDNLFDTIERHGLMLVAVDEANQLIGEIHASKYGIHIFEHILTGLTIAVHPAYQGQGVGKQLFQAFINEAGQLFPHVTRIELESRASNSTSIGLYRSVGFVEEGRMKNKTRNADGTFEDSLLMAWYKPE